MKKTIKIILIAVFVFIMNMANCYAEELNCNYVLRKGSTGNKVKALQRELNEKASCNLEVDGSYGKLTKQCVIKYQKEHNLDPDGIVGPKTCNSLNGNTVSSDTSSTKTSAVTTYTKDNNTYAIVLGSKVNVRKSSSTKSKVLKQVTRGTIVKVTSKKDNWSLVNVDRTTGYIRNDLISTDCIIVDISDQTLYFYSDGNLSWSTPVVTGNAGNHDTPVGSYTLKKSNFKSQVYLRGYNDNGTRYKSYVDYWMPFITSRGIGFHDASWRESWEYTNTRFQGHGSHGCVNMQHEAAEKLYNENFEAINVVVRD